MNGEMDLFELQTLVTAQNQIVRDQSPDKDKPEVSGPAPTEEEWDEINARTARILAKAGKS